MFQILDQQQIPVLRQVGIFLHHAPVTISVNEKTHVNKIKLSYYSSDTEDTETRFFFSKEIEFDLQISNASAQISSLQSEPAKGEY